MPTGMVDVHDALRRLIELEGSDLHLKVPSPPIVRVHGQLRPLDGVSELAPEDTEAVLAQLLTDPSRKEEFEAEHEVDFAYAVEGLARFRVNAFRQRGWVSIVMRAIPFQVRSIDALELPPVI